MFASIVLLPNYNNLLNFRLPSYCIDLWGYSLFSDIMYFFTFTHRYCQMSYQNTIIYISSIYYWLHNIINVIKDIRFEFSLIVGYSWILTSVCTILCFICYVSGIYSIEYAKVHSGQGYMSILSELTMTAACTTNIICGLFLNPSKTLAILRNILFILSIISLFLLEKRTPIIISALIIAAYIYGGLVISALESKLNI